MISKEWAILVNNPVINFLWLCSGFMNLWVFGYCPFCNGDSPLYYNCDVCEKFHVKFPYSFIPYNSKKAIWKRFINTLYDEKEIK